MTDVQKLLAEATPLPWRGPDPATRAVHAYTGTGELRGIVVVAGTPWQPNASLIVYAVNRLPDYEAAVEALERLTRHHEITAPNGDPTCPEIIEARAALARLRESDGPHDS